MTIVEEILHFWFGDNSDDSLVWQDKRKLWFGKNELLDREIDTRFATLVNQAGQQGLLMGDDPLSARYLATLLLLDQFTRNIYRGDARCFASDPLALQLALEVLQAGYDRSLRPIERVFIYLPLEHSEDLALQEHSVELFEELKASVAENCRQVFASFLDYAIRHRDIIARFGRFPHRNKILGRESTVEEAEFLLQPNSSF